ncbi:hypothetical protein LTR10_017348 [Elasticomyces elasticus]|uniref:Ketoreductase domain-containing protein n=1 Tax=Exophiala sideris TaxID=1016849 RepID=A0ABR0J8Z0_9EURO|nr:hypothetical protein LTR10_017348 [Elasticomyces elasticus]KAK5027895.1 hypothetical protein LTS07_006771 [Exophiala sideris]KAK5037515.1 hypothetical protein LTR13_004672 [Exophiala sideris]KAK5059176.1 hypothetical protein LTR69_006465 [Exophiala sideris]KAK5183010.1 hypothetical protein LTR44_004720 [Eurotiomycetes sp. CCFEE 6388]
MDAESLEYTIPFQLTKTIRRDPYDAIQGFSAAGKIIVITGGGTGIGAAAALVWARAGAEGVVLAGRRLDKLQETVSQVRALNNGNTKVLAVRTDLVKDGDVENLFAQTIKTFGRSPDVVLANAGAVATVPIGEQSPDDWWNVMGVNLKGVYATAHHFIKSQSDPKNPVGTFITVNSGLGGIMAPGMSAYSISKLAGQRFVEYLHTEYPSLRSFCMFPGIVNTDMVTATENHFAKYARDHADLTGLLALYLASPRADFLKGGLTSINWDVEEMEAHKEEIVEQKLLQIKWIPLLPASGGQGF